nr:MAG TPA: hypothetical protein [Caudoviricetes sp.]
MSFCLRGSSSVRAARNAPAGGGASGVVLTV